MSLTPEQMARYEQALAAGAYQAAWRYACRLAATRPDAEDLLQDALARALHCYPQLRDPTRFTAWLLSIVRARFLNEQRRQRRKPWLSLDQAAAAGAPLVAWSTSGDAGPGHALAEELAMAMARLPAAQREVLVLFYLDGFSLAETATVLGTSAAAVQQRLLRARGALRRAMPEAQACSSRGPAAEVTP